MLVQDTYDEELEPPFAVPTHLEAGESIGVPLESCRRLQTVERPRWTAMEARSGDLNFRATSTLTQRDRIGVPQLFPWELQAIRPIGAKIVVKIVVK
jgi:hypothetical protein